MGSLQVLDRQRLHSSPDTVVQRPDCVDLKRWWFAKELYDSAGYRRHCRRIARAVCDLAERYRSQEKRLYLITMGLSPSCGLRMTQSDPSL